MVNPYFTGRIPGLPGVPLSESSYAAEGLSLPGVLRALQGTQTPALRTTATGLEAMPGVTYAQVRPDGGMPFVPVTPVQPEDEECTVKWTAYVVIVVQDYVQVLAIGGVPNPAGAADPNPAFRRFKIPWQSGEEVIPSKQKCIFRNISPPANLSATVLNTRSGRTSRASLRLLKAPFPAMQRLCCGDNFFEFVYSAQPACDGEYNITLFVDVRGGALGPMQVARILGPLGGRVAGPDGPEVLESPTPGPAGPGNTYSFEWPWKQARCGPHVVALDASKIPLAGGFQLIIQDNPRQFTIEHDGQKVGLVFRGELFVPEGGPPPPPKQQPQDAGQPLEEFPPEGFPPEGFGESYPSDFGLPAFPEAVTDELWRSSESEIDPQAALLGGFSLGGVPGPAADGPPWTQMDIVVDPNASLDARGAVDLHDIEGSNMVRGLFDGRFRGFVPGL